MLAARKAGKLRYIGFTGHYDPDVHVKLLQLAEKNDFKFDTGMITLNVMDAHFKSFAQKVLPILHKQGTGILAFKSLGAGRFFKPDNVLERIKLTREDCLRYVMSLPVSVVISGMDDPQMLKENVATASHFRPLADEERTSILAKTLEPSQGGKYEWFKTEEGLGWTKAHPEMFS
jgi:predicted aldo/keto reductase-like oxidoreductase